MITLKTSREMLKGYNQNTQHTPSDQELQLPQPPLEKPVDTDTALIDLPDPLLVDYSKKDILTCINDRVSQRRFSDKEVTLAELSFLLWTTQGVKQTAENNYFTKRTVPSGGARHPFETYLGVNQVQGLTPGIYRYIALQHKLVYLYSPKHQREALTECCCGQKFAGESAVVFAWATYPYRVEWRYGRQTFGAKALLLDAGHVCQNLYLACEALGLGTCAIAAYQQELSDELFQLDGEDEFMVYISPVGHPLPSNSQNRIS